MKPKFHHGDVVPVTGVWVTTLYPWMKETMEAIVFFSRSDNEGRHRCDGLCRPCEYEESYELYFKDHGTSAWYDEHQLTLIEPNRCDLLEQWQDQYEDDRRTHKEEKGNAQ